MTAGSGLKDRNVVSWGAEVEEVLECFSCHFLSICLAFSFLKKAKKKSHKNTVSLFSLMNSLSCTLAEISQ